MLSCVLNAQGLQKELLILHTNDTHSQIEPYTHKADTNVGGALRREAFVRSVRAQHAQVLLFDAGDFSQGTPYFNFFKGYTEVYLMNKMHYDAAALGNHEFDNGSAALAKRIRKAQFPVLCSNYEFQNKALSKAVKPFTVFQMDGLKIGVFGLLADLKPLTMPSVYRELKFLDPVRSAQSMVAQLKAQGCDLIICLSHLGTDEDAVWNDFILAREVPDIDVIIGGHSHKEMKEPALVGHTRIYQMANRGKCVGQITINY